jgi:hypothetical protein
MSFSSPSIIFLPVIEYKKIEKIILTQFSIKIKTKSGGDFKFVVWHRQEIKEFLEYKRI